MLQANDDLDDLFRKAAENYPLKTDNADWEKVRPLILPADDTAATSSSPKKNYKNLLWLLLLLPIVWGAYKVISKNNQPIKNQFLLNNKSPLPPAIKIPSYIAKQAKPNDAKQLKPDNKNIKANILNSVNADRPESNTAKELTINKYKKIDSKERSFRPNTKVSIINSDEVAFGESNGELNKSTIEKTKDPSAEIKNNDVKNGRENKNDQENNPIQEKTLNPEEKKVNIIDTSANKNNHLKSLSKGKQPHGLYAGLIAGPDLSTIKFQSTKKIGLNIGVIAGYQFNKIFSIESGAVWNKKFYYSTGKYFNTAKIYVPVDSKIKDVNGYCEMIEVPVNLKINLASSKKNNWFSVAGLSSYFMKNEDYDYTISNAWGNYPYSKKYKESSSFLLAAINVGIGYSHSIGKGGALRIEPYAKIPLSGVGIGKLPITSAGINIGFTKKFFK